MNETKQLTREQADACLKLVQEKITERAGAEWARELMLHEPGFHTGGWSISLDGVNVIYDNGGWPWEVSNEIGEFGWPEGVHAEAVNNCILGLYVLWSDRPQA